MNIEEIIENGLEELAYNFLTSINYKMYKEQSSFIQLLKLRQWSIEDKPRKVSFAKNFSVPEKNKIGLSYLIEKIENGKGELYRHQSRGLFDGKKIDLMFYDFGIHHLHLGIETDLKYKRFIQGTDEILFAYINDDEVFFIKVAKHGEWNFQNNIKTIHLERPDLIKSRVCASVKTDRLSDEEIFALRTNGYNYFLNIEGVTYRPQIFLASRTDITLFFLKRDIQTKMQAVVVSSLENNKFNKVDTINLKIIDFDFVSLKKFTFTLTFQSKNLMYEVNSFR